MATSASNTLINMGQSTAMKVIAKMLAVHFSNSMVMGQLVNRALQTEFSRKGDVITYKKPQRSVVLDGPDITNQIQSTVQQSSTMTVDKFKTINFEWGIKELSLTPESFFKEVLADPMEKLPNQVDMDLLNLYQKVYHVRGPQAGARAINFDDVIDCGVEAQQMSIPGKLNLVLAPTDHGELAKDMKGVFLPQFVEGIVRSAQLGRLGAFQTFMDQNVKEHSQATISGYLVNDTVASGDTTITIDTGSGTPAVGDVFSIANVNAVNPMNYTSTGRAKRFTVTSYASNVITFTPAMTSTGAYQNIDALPADDAAITFEGSHTANLAFSKSAFSLAVVPLAPIDGLEQYTASHKGINITISTDGDIKTYTSIKRMDILYGVDASYPEHAIRLMG